MIQPATRPFVPLLVEPGLAVLRANRLVKTHLSTCELPDVRACRCAWLTCNACRRGLHTFCMRGMVDPFYRDGRGVDCHCEPCALTSLPPFTIVALAHAASHVASCTADIAGCELCERSLFMADRAFTDVVCALTDITLIPDE